MISPSLSLPECGDEWEQCGWNLPETSPTGGTWWWFQLWGRREGRLAGENEIVGWIMWRQFFPIACCLQILAAVDRFSRWFTSLAPSSWGRAPQRGASDWFMRPQLPFREDYSGKKNKIKRENRRIKWQAEANEKMKLVDKINNFFKKIFSNCFEFNFDQIWLNFKFFSIFFCGTLIIFLIWILALNFFKIEFWRAIFSNLNFSPNSIKF